LLDAVITGNLEHQLEIVRQIATLLAKYGGKSVAVLGLTFKAGTDDLRDSPALFIVQQLLDSGFVINAYDPTVSTKSNPSLNSVNICSSVKEAAQTSDLLVVLTEWPEFSELDPSELTDVMISRHIFDTRGIIDKEKWTNSGFTVKTLGRA
jgi:UDPglucose 6-dehydrogenase